MLKEKGKLIHSRKNGEDVTNVLNAIDNCLKIIDNKPNQNTSNEITEIPVYHPQKLPLRGATPPPMPQVRQGQPAFRPATNNNSGCFESLKGCASIVAIFILLLILIGSCT
jgi:hypothetical protein